MKKEFLFSLTAGWTVLGVVQGFVPLHHHNDHGSRIRTTTTVASSPPFTTTTRTQLGFFNFGGKPTEEEEAKPEEAKPAEEEEDQDPVEKIFSFFFGKPEEEPFGLKRFGKDRFPEQYPATVDEWAAPLDLDSRDVAVLRPLLKNTNLEFRDLQLTYSANKDGWDATKFHQAVDRKGGALVVCTTQLGLVCGGYNPKGWVGYGEARGSIAAFLFVQKPFGGGFTKLRKVGGAGLAQWYVHGRILVDGRI